METILGIIGFVTSVWLTWALVDVFIGLCKAGAEGIRERKEEEEKRKPKVYDPYANKQKELDEYYNSKLRIK